MHGHHVVLSHSHGVRNLLGRALVLPGSAFHRTQIVDRFVKALQLTKLIFAIYSLYWEWK